MPSEAVHGLWLEASMAEAGLNAGCRVLEVERAWPQRKEGCEGHPHYCPHREGRSGSVFTLFLPNNLV